MLVKCNKFGKVEKVFTKYSPFIHFKILIKVGRIAGIVSVS